jgi:hypothetical protein
MIIEKTDMAEYLFSYGTFQEEEVQLKRFGRQLNGSRDILEDYRLSRIEILDESFLAKGEERSYMTLVPTGICGDFVEGTVFEVSEAELLLADAHEPNSFVRMKIVLRSGKIAWTYVSR